MHEFRNETATADLHPLVRQAMDEDLDREIWECLHGPDEPRPAQYPRVYFQAPVDG